MRLYFLFYFSNLNQSIYIQILDLLKSVLVMHLKPTTRNPDFIFMFIFFLLTPHGNFNVQKHKHTKQKQCKAKTKQTNKQTPPPPPKKKKTFRVLIKSVTGCKDSIPIFLFEEKKRGIWLSTTHTVTQGATPVRWGADKHVTKLTGVTGQLV